MGKTNIKIITGMYLSIFVIVFIFLNSYPISNAVFMNGEISAKHSYLKNDCKACHVPWEGVKDANCIKCHVDNRHYYDEIAKAYINKIRCFDCHLEHQGRTYDPEVTAYSPSYP
jgi:hypothetical protein